VCSWCLWLDRLAISILESLGETFTFGCSGFRHVDGYIVLDDQQRERSSSGREYLLDDDLNNCKQTISFFWYEGTFSICMFSSYLKGFFLLYLTSLYDNGIIDT
jgi:hypothetical protein